MREFYQRDWSMAEKVLLTASALLFGAVMGFLWAPVKKGVYCGNHNGNMYRQDEKSDRKSKCEKEKKAAE